MSIGIINEAVASGARREAACEIFDLSARTLERWRGDKVQDLRSGPKQPPANKLSQKERQVVLKLINEPRFRELSPNQIVPLLADDKRDVASESTMYRIMRDEDLLKHRGRAKAPVRRVQIGPRQAARSVSTSGSAAA